MEKYTEAQARLLDEVDFVANTQKKPATIYTGRYKAYSVATLRSLVNRGVIEVSTNGKDFDISSITFINRSTFYVKRK